MMSEQQEISNQINKSFLGKEMDILIDEDTKKNLFTGRTEFDAPEVDGQVYIRSKNARVGEFLKARIVDTYEYDLVGEEIK